MEKITLEEYKSGILTLVTLASNHVGSSAATAAQVLLSTFNGSEWHVDLTALCNLDEEYYQAALAVIRGRVECQYEPHTLIDNGRDIFSQLWDHWCFLHVGNRNLDVCPDCYGNGQEYNDDGDRVIGVCRTCDGAGRVNHPRYQHRLNITNKFTRE